MTGAIQWDALGLAGAFVLGAILATVAVLRVVRALAVMLRQEVRRSREDD